MTAALDEPHVPLAHALPEGANQRPRAYRDAQLWVDDGMLWWASWDPRLRSWLAAGTVEHRAFTLTDEELETLLHVSWSLLPRLGLGTVPPREHTGVAHALVERGILAWTSHGLVITARWMHALGPLILGTDLTELRPADVPADGSPWPTLARAPGHAVLAVPRGGGWEITVLDPAAAPATLADEAMRALATSSDSIVIDRSWAAGKQHRTLSAWPTMDRSALEHSLAASIPRRRRIFGSPLRRPLPWMWWAVAIYAFATIGGEVTRALTGSETLAWLAMSPGILMLMAFGAGLGAFFYAISFGDPEKPVGLSRLAFLWLLMIPVRRLVAIPRPADYWGPWSSRGLAALGQAGAIPDGAAPEPTPTSPTERMPASRGSIDEIGVPAPAKRMPAVSWGWIDEATAPEPVSSPFGESEVDLGHARLGQEPATDLRAKDHREAPAARAPDAVRIVGAWVADGMPRSAPGLGAVPELHAAAFLDPEPVILTDAEVAVLIRVTGMPVARFGYADGIPASVPDALDQLLARGIIQRSAHGPVIAPDHLGTVGLAFFGDDVTEVAYASDEPRRHQCLVRAPGRAVLVEPCDGAWQLTALAPSAGEAALLDALAGALPPRPEAAPGGVLVLSALEIGRLREGNGLADASPAEQALTRAWVAAIEHAPVAVVMRTARTPGDSGSWFLHAPADGIWETEARPAAPGDRTMLGRGEVSIGRGRDEVMLDRMRRRIHLGAERWDAPARIHRPLIGPVRARPMSWFWLAAATGLAALPLTALVWGVRGEDLPISINGLCLGVLAFGALRWNGRLLRPAPDSLPHALRSYAAPPAQAGPC